MCTQIWILVEDLWIQGRDFMKYPWEIFWQKIINTILKSWDVRFNSNILNIGVEIFSARLFRKLIGFFCLWERWYSAIVYRVYVGVSGKELWQSTMAAIDQKEISLCEILNTNSQEFGLLNIAIWSTPNCHIVTIIWDFFVPGCFYREVHNSHSLV